MSFFEDLKAQLNSIDKEALRRKFAEATDGLDPESIKLKLEQSGLKSKVESWVDNSKESIPASVEEIKAALGPELAKLAAKTGETAEALAAKIAETMPKIVEKLSSMGKGEK